MAWTRSRTFLSTMVPRPKWFPSSDPKNRDHARRKHGINHHPSNGKDLVYQAYNGQEWRNGVQVQGGLEADG